MELHQQLLQLPKDLAVPYDFTLHDYYAICPQYMLVRSDGSYCGEPDIEGCNACLAERPAPWGLDIGAWRSLFTHLLNGAERVIAPSRDTLERVKRYIPEARYLYLPHPEPDIPSSPVIKFPSPDGELKVLVLGLLSRAKGLKLLEGCAIDAKNRKLPLFFEVIGSALEQTAQEPAIPLTFSGPYRDDDLAQLIARARADILFFPALWPETYSYTLSAAMRSGLPIAAPRLGAFPERLADYPAAWLLDWDSTPHAWNDLFLSLRTPAQSLDPSKEHNHGTG
jgi:glycosyltransferase involved in cell wall biosynthesis